tara:strand:- start:10 stop:180 length:171 start_codon:yes stop_codon:yes gene_type:complete
MKLKTVSNILMLVGILGFLAGTQMYGDIAISGMLAGVVGFFSGYGFNLIANRFSGV